MIRIIREHNTLNGLKFSLIEFLLMALVTLSLAGYLGVTGHLAFGLIALGISANCLTVVGLAGGSLRVGEPDRGWRATFSPSERAAVLRDHPRAQRDTWVLAAFTVVPFLVIAMTVLARRSSGG